MKKAIILAVALVLLFLLIPGKTQTHESTATQQTYSIPTPQTASSAIVTEPSKSIEKNVKVSSEKNVNSTVEKNVKPVASTSTWMSTFNRLKRQLPGRYIIADKGSWGATHLSSGTVYIARRTPLRYLDDVMKHESIHVRQGRVYGGIVNARKGLARYGGIEAVADCGARMLGATWTHYVRYCTPAMNKAARAMLNYRRP